MNDFDEATSPAGIAADNHVYPVGPLDSRRARRARKEAEAAAQEMSSMSLDAGHNETPQQPTIVIFSDELAAARERKRDESEERVPHSYQDLG
jgi:hypothetical protein